MTPPGQRNPRRTDALSRERIVEACIEILDSAGEGGLTVRAVTARLATGRGAIYHHITGKDELLVAATDGVVAQALADVGDDSGPEDAVRSLALGIFEAIGRHPWVGAQLSRDPFQPAVLKIWTSVGIQLQRLGLRHQARSDAGASLTSYVLGAAAQYAAGAARATDADERAQFLHALATHWTQQDETPLARESAASLQEHDDREQFLAGVNIFLAGITHPGSGG